MPAVEPMRTSDPCPRRSTSRRIRPRDEERRREVRAQGLVPALERKLPHGHVVPRPHALDLDADVDLAERGSRLVEEAVDVGLVREVGLDDRRSAELVGERSRPLVAAVEVDDDPCALGSERANARRADAARRPGHEHALALKPRLDAA